MRTSGSRSDSFLIRELRIKKSLTEIYLSRMNNHKYPRCHLDSQLITSCVLCRVLTYPRQLTYAFTLQNTQHTDRKFRNARSLRRYACYRIIRFVMPLTAPSAVHLEDLCFTRLSASRALCGIIINVISASSVYVSKVYSSGR